MRLVLNPKFLTSISEICVKKFWVTIYISGYFFHVNEAAPKKNFVFYIPNWKKSVDFRLFSASAAGH